MASAPAKAMGNDEKPPTRPAASAGTTSSDSGVGWRNVIGAINAPASAASAPPSAQFVTAITSGECPRLAAARWFSATALVTRPNVV